MNNINKEVGKIHECTSCQICSAICPCDAIEIKLNSEGFYRPYVIKDKCINCGMCIRYCYKYDVNIKTTKEFNDIISYSARAKDYNLVKKSTSGGISSLLMKACIELGYDVVGVTYDYNHDKAVAKIVSNINSIEIFRGSKYMQAYTEKVYRSVINGDKSNKYAIFGTPCHTYPLYKKVLEKGRKDKYIFIDLFCHGCPSIHLWNKYIEKVKFDLGTDKFDEIFFRSKDKGWHEYTNAFVYDNKRHVSPNTINDPFFSLFFDDEILNDACYDCKLRSTMEYTDIRLGDYWGDKHQLDTKGVSAVVISSKKGIELFNLIKQIIDFELTKIEDIIKAQSYGKKHNYNLQIRNDTFELLKSDLNINEIFKMYLKRISIKKKTRRFAKKLVFLLPTSLQYRIKKAYHRILS